MDIIEQFMKREVEYIKEISEKDRLILNLRNESGIARDAIQRYCPGILRDSAERWLKHKGLL